MDGIFAFTNTNKNSSIIVVDFFENNHFKFN
jgi:hypothetical protein